MDGIVGGPVGCSGLSDLGRRQVEALARRWETRPPAADVLLSSTLPRAIETAELLAPVLGDLPVVQREDLCELFPGESDAITWEQFRARYRPDGWSYDPHRPMAPGAESWVAFQARVADALRSVSTEHVGRTVVVACHGGIVDGSMHHLLGLPVTGPRSWRVTNSSVTEWRLEEGADGEAPDRAWRLLRFNDAAHLEGAALD
jgi:2,3-bisphosphoglycerate-dependent phosphoglycerate mutase